MNSTSFPLSRLSDSSLLASTKKLVAEERRVTTLVLDHLAEVERRRLYALLGYSSLYEYALKELKYTEAAAHRRIAAMRLMKELPEVRDKVKSGALSLSAVAQAQSFFRKEEQAIRKETSESRSASPKITTEGKSAILSKLENQSSRQCEKTLLSLSSHPELHSKPDRIRPLSETHSEIRFTADQALLDDLEKLRGLLAHKNPQLSMAELIQEIARIALQKLDPTRKPTRSKEASESALSPQLMTGRMKDLPPTSAGKTHQNYLNQVDRLPVFGSFCGF